MAAAAVPGVWALLAAVSERRYVAIGLGLLAWLAVLVLGVHLAGRYAAHVATAPTFLTDALDLLSTLVPEIAVLAGLILGYHRWRG